MWCSHIIQECFCWAVMPYGSHTITSNMFFMVMDQTNLFKETSIFWTWLLQLSVTHGFPVTGCFLPPSSFAASYSWGHLTSCIHSWNTLSFLQCFEPFTPRLSLSPFSFWLLVLTFLCQLHPTFSLRFWYPEKVPLSQFLRLHTVLSPATFQKSLCLGSSPILHLHTQPSLLTFPPPSWQDKSVFYLFITSWI